MPDSIYINQRPNLEKLSLQTYPPVSRVFTKAQPNYSALIDNYMNAAVTVNQFSGSILVAKHNNIFYEKTFGTTDYANTKSLDSNSTFELGIITEEFTAAAILILKDEGKLQLSDPVTKYLPELPYSSVTIEHLLTHTSGLPDVYEEVMKNKWGTSKYASIDDMVKMIADAKVPLAWQPGTKYDADHNNYFTDYPLLAAIIQKISHKSYAQFMQQRIFTPLHLQHTIVFISNGSETAKNPNETEIIYFDESKQQFFPADSFTYFGNEINHATQNLIGGRGISSTAHDLFLFNKALQNQSLLSASSQKEMFTPLVLIDTVNKIFTGYGVQMGKNEFGDYVQQFDGGNNETLGYITKFIHYTQGDLTIIQLANKAKSSSSISGTLAYILFDKEIVPPYIHKQVSIDTSLLDKYVGDYAMPGITKLYRKEGTLWVTIHGEPDLKLLPESSNKFFSSDKEYDWQIEFITDANGKLVKTFFIYSGLKKEVKKL